MQRGDVPSGWQLVLPVKGGSGAKSRLGLGVRAPHVALAMALDCLEAVLASPSVARVVVVTGDDDTHDAASALGADVVADPPTGGGLFAAVQVGLASVAGPAAVLLPDLPCLRPGDLTRGLAKVGEALAGGASSVFIPDADGVGTVLLAGPDPALLHPRFGGASAAAHEAGGATRLELDLPRLRRDVDTPDALRQALQLRVGRRTAATLAIVQTTVLTFDPLSGAGTVVTDDGVEIDLAQEALAGSGLRHLRPGQRVTCELVPGPLGEDLVTSVRIVGIGD
ncbi:MAG TPA: 2-phospho-L-lactate guanylyltransferase [Actinomycetales bacterium]|nr:2-phospho-L-lactate guanylyltransferase [Actinomycetales bacterium]